MSKQQPGTVRWILQNTVGWWAAGQRDKAAVKRDAKQAKPKK